MISSQSPTTAELSGPYYALEHKRTSRPPNWISITSSKAALLYLKASAFKTANQILCEDIHNMNDLLHRYCHATAYQWIPGHVRINGVDTADMASICARISSQPYNLPLKLNEAL